MKFLLGLLSGVMLIVGAIIVGGYYKPPTRGIYDDVKRGMCQHSLTYCKQQKVLLRETLYTEYFIEKYGIKKSKIRTDEELKIKTFMDWYNKKDDEELNQRQF